MKSRWNNSKAPNSNPRLVISMHLHLPLSESYCWRVTAILGLLLINPKSPSFFSFLSQVITRILRIRFQIEPNNGS